MITKNVKATFGLIFSNTQTSWVSMLKEIGIEVHEVYQRTHTTVAAITLTTIQLLEFITLNPDVINYHVVTPKELLTDFSTKAFDHYSLTSSEFIEFIEVIGVACDCGEITHV